MIFPGNTVQSFRPKDAAVHQLSVLKYPVPMPLNQQALEGTIQLSLGIRGVFGKLLSKKACKVGVAEALLNEFSGEFTGHPTHTVQLVTSETTNLYYVAISCEAANPGQLAIARAIAESFRFE